MLSVEEHFVRSIKLGSDYLNLLNFKLVHSGEKVEDYQNFWQTLFSLYDLVSIKISKNACHLVIGIKTDREIDENELISSVKTIGMKNLPNDVELQTQQYMLDNIEFEKENIILDKKLNLFRKYITFSDLKLHSSFLRTLHGLMEIDGLELYITNEKFNNKSKKSITLSLSNANINDIKIDEERLFIFQQHNPAIEGDLGEVRIISKNDIKKHQGRTLLGFNDHNISEQVVLDILKVTPDLMKKWNSQTQHITPFPWVGFQNYNISSIKTLLVEDPLDLEIEEYLEEIEDIEKIDETQLFISEFIHQIATLGYYNVSLDEKINNKISVNFKNSTLVFYVFNSLPEIIPDYITRKFSFVESQRLLFIITDDNIQSQWERLSIDIINFNEFGDFVSNIDKLEKPVFW